MRHLIAFCRLLRRHGIPVTTFDVIDALRALERLDLSDSHEVRTGLRTVLVSRVDDLRVFDRCFDLFWHRRGVSILRRDERLQDERSPEGTDKKSNARRAIPDLSIDRWAGEQVETAGDLIDAPGASDRENLLGQDFSTFSDEQLDELFRVAIALARRMAGDARRQWRPARRGLVDFRRTVRANLGRAEWIELRRHRHKRRPLRLVMLCDVSGSMNLYSRVLVLFIYALHQTFARIETFSFATRLTRITGHLRGATYREALDRLTAVGDWSGGTRIGASLAQFNRDWAHLVDRQTVVIILSDGWDTGGPELLVSALTHLRRRARRVIWLNPLLGSPGYQPLARGMAAALPLVDQFAPAHNLHSLRDFARGL